MKLKIILDNRSGASWSHVIKVREDQDENAVIDNAVIGLLQHTWTLAPGDTIRIVEVGD